VSLTMVIVTNCTKLAVRTLFGQPPGAHVPLTVAEAAGT
jgi:hypothetical protein